MRRISMIASLAVLLAGQAVAGEGETYEVTITNLTRGQTFTPLLVVAHSADIKLFDVGTPASDEIVTMAESGETAPLETLLSTVPDLVGDYGSSGDLLTPGQSVTVIVSAEGAAARISVAGMLIPTNDTFVGLDSLVAPRNTGGSRSVLALAYDAGSETNDEDCANIPGPVCGGAALSPEDDGEGYVHISAGIKGSETLDGKQYDWRNPVARVQVVRAR